MFKCEFSEGSVRHTALLGLDVALLPDPIKMVMDPLTVDCSEGESSSETVMVTTTIAPTTEAYKVTWFYRDAEQATLTPTGEHTLNLLLIYLKNKTERTARNINILLSIRYNYTIEFTKFTKKNIQYYFKRGKKMCNISSVSPVRDLRFQYKYK